MTEVASTPFDRAPMTSLFCVYILGGRALGNLQWQEAGMFKSTEVRRVFASPVGSRRGCCELRSYEGADPLTWAADDRRQRRRNPCM
ncbi:hypothetical protein ElyMa_006173200 [Elysia marginata]|uniref:Uncharacterized protein n=1 Tax=Elysia marginata TaxID=1093978 RepID=A0AAV4GZK2_9GAST|nr:hypothetical protein ElyMa_006173200 [Elysia marginata]